jgi:hypothetical protein
MAGMPSLVRKITRIFMSFENSGILISITVVAD